MAKKQISVIERRLQGRSALQTSSTPIPLNEKGWTLLWGNSDISQHQIWHLVHELGWDYVTPEDLACGLDDIGATQLDTRVVRGERGKEVLLKMRTSDYVKVQKKKTQENLEVTFDKTKVTDAMVNAVGAEHGSEAADVVRRSGITVDDSRVADGE